MTVTHNLLLRCSAAFVSSAALVLVTSCTNPRPTARGTVAPRANELAQAEPWTRVEPGHVLLQSVHSAYSCGPAALGTAFMAEGQVAEAAVEALGDEAIASSVSTYGERPSDVYEERPRFSIESGVCAEDLLAWTNDWRADLQLGARTGLYLDRLEDEDAASFCLRIHDLLVDSLRAAAAPIVRLRSFVPSYQPQRGAYLWQGVAGHWVTLTGVPTILRPGAIGFAFEYADPASGALAAGYVSVENERPFAAAKGNAQDWVWLDKSPFLVATVPEQATLGVDNQPWFIRTVVTLDYAIVAEQQSAAN